MSATTYAEPFSYTCINMSGSPKISSDLSNGFYVAASVANAATEIFLMDTGSAGMVVPSNYISTTTLAQYPSFGVGQMHYVPSDEIITGTWYLLPASLESYGSNGYTATGVTGWAMVLVSDDWTSDFMMMGVAGKGDNPLFNLFFNLWNDALPLPPGYSIEVKGSPEVVTVTLGQTYETFKNQYKNSYSVFLQPTTIPPLPSLTSLGQGSSTTPYMPPSLTPVWATKTWSLPNASLNVTSTVNGNTYNITMHAGFELDTGIQCMLIAPDPQTSTILSEHTITIDNSTYPALPPNINVTFEIAGNAQSLIQAAESSFYLNFNTSTTSDGQNQGTAPAPTTVFVMPPPTNCIPQTVRINTGRNPLATYIYGYDALNGVISWAPVASN